MFPARLHNRRWSQILSAQENEIKKLQTNYIHNYTIDIKNKVINSNLLEMWHLRTNHMDHEHFLSSLPWITCSHICSNKLSLFSDANITLWEQQSIQPFHCCCSARLKNKNQTQQERHRFMCNSRWIVSWKDQFTLKYVRGVETRFPLASWLQACDTCRLQHDRTECV